MIKLIENNVKICTGCKREKTKDHFKDKNNNETKRCDTCRNYENKRGEKRRNEINEKKRVLTDESHRICNKCAKEKDIIYFKNKRKTKIHHNCSECRKYMAEDKMKKRKDNPEKDIEYRDEYNETNKQELVIKDRSRYLDNREYMLYNSAKQHSKQLNLSFDITEEYVKEIFPIDNKCPITKKEFIIAEKFSCNCSANIDKIDPNLGYIKGNIQILSCIANRVKSNCTLSELEFILKGFKLLPIIPIEHAIDELTRNIIIKDRLNAINNDINCKPARKNRILNLELYLVISAEKRALKKQMPFDIDEDYIKSIWQLNNKCPITNIPYEIGRQNSFRTSATIDRIELSKGYVKGNVRIISYRANSIKNELNLEEFETMVKGFREYYDRTGTGIIL